MDYGTDYYYATDGGPGAGAATTTPAIQTPLAPQTPMATNPPFQPQPTPAIQSTIQPLVPPNQVVYPSPQQAQPYNEVQVRPYPSYPCCPYMSPMNPCCQSFTVQVQMNNFCTLPQNCGMYG
uniref:Uncharacterized protein n=1 Tax=Romanomermis culicivorax TaxID=13658 RepID=A0A915K4N3_ROMCU